MPDEPTSLDTFLSGAPSPEEGHRKDFLGRFGKSGAADWALMAQAMAGLVKEAMSRKRQPILRKELRESFEAIEAATESLLRALGQSQREIVKGKLLRHEQAVIDAFAIYAPPDLHGIDDETGIQFVASLQRRAREVLGNIPSGKGRSTAAPALGHPSASQLCAAMVHLAFEEAFGVAPGDKRKEALAAYDDLWKAAGGEALNELTDSPERHLKEFRKGSGKTTGIARSAAHSRLKYLDVHRQKST